jgi:hypothetical protein
MPSTLLLKGRELKPHKAIVAPLFQARSVLTDEPWAFVRLFLKREGEAQALFYWDQAKTFHDASSGLPPESAPLLLYYSFLNAAKALLSAKGIQFNPYHGVKEWKTGARGRDCLKQVGVEVKGAGVLPALAAYLGDAEPTKRHSLQTLFFNMPFVHRTYCLTYRAQGDMYLPLRKCRFVRDAGTGTGYLAAEVAAEHLSARVMSRLPPTFQQDAPQGKAAIRSVSTIPLRPKGSPSSSELQAIGTLHRSLRADLFYINGSQTLWYIKLLTKGPPRLARHNPTLIMAAMHRLSELCRYHPMAFAEHLDSPANWLLHEFVAMSPKQYIDEIAAELTGHEFLVPNVRPTS